MQLKKSETWGAETHSATSANPRRQRGNSAESILIAAVGLFALKGFDQTSIGEICTAAGVTRPTIYYFYGSKEGLFRAVMKRARHHFRDRVLKAVGRYSDSRQHWIHLGHLCCEDAIRNPQMWRLMLGSIWPVCSLAHSGVAPIRDELVQVLMVDNTDASNWDSDHNESAAASYIFAGTICFIIARYLSTGKPDLTSVAQRLVKDIFGQVCIPKAEGRKPRL